jgi:hypothetical protein
MSDLPPDEPWVDQTQFGPPQQPWQQQPGPQPRWQQPPPQPGGRQGAPTPLAAINKRVNLALALSVLSVFCGGIVLSIIALVLVFRAQAQARSFGVTSSDRKIRTAKWIAIGATVLWAIVIIAIVISAANHPTNNSGA